MVRLSDRAAKRLVVLLAFTCVLTLGARARAQAAEGGLRLAGATGFDSNARRDFLETGAEPDFLASARLAAQGRLQRDGFSAEGRYDVGARKFLHVADADALVQALSLEAGAPLGRFVRLGLAADGKDRRGDRPYTELLGGPFLGFSPDAQVEVRLEARAHRFLYWQVFGYSFWAPELQAWAQYRFDRRHTAFASAELGTRRYSAPARDFPDVQPPRDLGRRQDATFAGTLGYSFRGPFSLSATYGFFSADSNSYGESFQRHRLTLSGAVRLPARFILLGDMAVQLTRYPDGVYLSQQFALKQDDESFNQLSLRLVRPLSERVDLELTYALYYTRFPANALTYLRHVGSVGVTVQF